MSYRVVTRWTAADGASFERTHEREARDAEQARQLEVEHNATRFTDPVDVADGWTSEIVSVVALCRGLHGPGF